MIYTNYMSPDLDLLSEYFDTEKIVTVKEFGERRNKKSCATSVTHRLKSSFSRTLNGGQYE